MVFPLPQALAPLRTPPAPLRSQKPPSPTAFVFPKPSDFYSRHSSASPTYAYPKAAFLDIFMPPPPTPSTPRISKTTQQKNINRAMGKAQQLCQSLDIPRASSEEFGLRGSGRRGDPEENLQHLAGGMFPNAWSALT